MSIVKRRLRLALGFVLLFVIGVPLCYLFVVVRAFFRAAILDPWYCDDLDKEIRVEWLKFWAQWRAKS